jgi:hypothetical protein
MVGEPEGRDQLEDVRIDLKVLLKWRCRYLRTGASSGLLCYVTHDLSFVRLLHVCALDPLIRARQAVLYAFQCCSQGSVVLETSV